MIRRSLLLIFLPALLFADEVYFSPDGGIRDRIVERIHRAHRSIDVAMYSLTSQEIAEALADAKRRGVHVRLVRDASQTSERGDEDAFLAGQGIEIHVIRGLGRGIMHDKFAVFDGREGFSGSYNWTNNAEYDNHESALFLTNPALLRSYETEFERLWEAPQVGQVRPTPASAPTSIRQHPVLAGLAVLAIVAALVVAMAT